MEKIEELKKKKNEILNKLDAGNLTTQEELKLCHEFRQLMKKIRNIENKQLKSK
jgi:hypothetical protein